MSNKRGSRGKSKAKNAVVLKIKDEEQLHRTIDLLNVHGDKPHVNDVMVRIMERLDEEERVRMLNLARSWVGRSWSDEMIYDCMGEDYPGFDDEVDYEEISSKLSGRNRKLKALNKKLFKRMNRTKGKGKGNKRYEPINEDTDDFWANRHSMYHGEVDDLDNEDNYEEGYKCIKFYHDIENELSVQEFDSLKEFNDFCGEHGYIMGTVDYNNLVNNPVVHCCLDPISLEYGEKEVVTDNSYGALYWSVSDDVTKKEEQSLEPYLSDADARNFSY